MIRLYIGRKDGGRRLISVEDCVRQEELGLHDKYVLRTEELILGVLAR